MQLHIKTLISYWVKSPILLGNTYKLRLRRRRKKDMYQLLKDLTNCITNYGITVKYKNALYQLDN